MAILYVIRLFSFESVIYKNQLQLLDELDEGNRIAVQGISQHVNQNPLAKIGYQLEYYHLLPKY